MNRRSFLKKLLATGAVAVAPVGLLPSKTFEQKVIEEFELTGKLHNVKLILTEPLHITKQFSSIINCVFEASPGFKDKHMIVIDKGVSNCIVSGCTLSSTNLGIEIAS